MPRWLWITRTRFAPGRAPHYTHRRDDDPVPYPSVPRNRVEAHSGLSRPRVARAADRAVARGGPAGAAVHSHHAENRKAVLGADDQLRTVGLGVRCGRLPLSGGP